RDRYTERNITDIRDQQKFRCRKTEHHTGVDSDPGSRSKIPDRLMNDLKVHADRYFDLLFVIEPAPIECEFVISCDAEDERIVIVAEIIGRRLIDLSHPL